MPVNIRKKGPPIEGAQCCHCRSAMTATTVCGMLLFYVCLNEECPRFGLASTAWVNPPEEASDGMGV